MEILQILNEKLDPEDGEQWTRDGVPKLDVMSGFAGRTVSREEVMEVDPYFTRESLAAKKLEEAEAAAAKADEESADKIDPEKDDPETLDTEEKEVTDLDEHLAQMKEIDAEIEAAEAEKDQAEKKISNLNAKKDALILKRDAVSKSESAYAPIKHYLESQDNLRRQRAARISAAQEAAQGLPLNTKAPIDQAFGRRKQRGVQRPKHPMIK